MNYVDFEQAVTILAQGGVLVAPTDTLYGLIARHDRPSALKRIVEIKGRDVGVPFPLLCSDPPMARGVSAAWPVGAEELVSNFWPGALTLVVTGGDEWAKELRNENGGIGLRVPADDDLRKLIRRMGVPLIGTSANRHNEPAPRYPEELDEDLLNQTDGVFKAPPPSMGMHSTIVDLTVDPPALLRDGAIPFDEVLRHWHS